MVEVTATELRTRTGLIIDQALREPVRVMRNQRAVAVMLSSDEFARLESIEDAYWGEAAKTALQSGFAEKGDIQKLLEQLN